MPVGVLLFLWDASRTNDELNALNAETGYRKACIERCMSLVGESGAAPKDQLSLCECVVEKASARAV
ncbi:MAG: hypothetical protein AAF941_00930 [Pseudomonadota bacterium]